MKVVLIQNPNNQNEIKTFMPKQIKNAIHYASEMYALNYLLQSEVDIKDKQVINSREYYTIGEIRQLISNFIQHPNPKVLYDKIGENFVWIYVIDLSNKSFWGK